MKKKKLGEFGCYDVYEVKHGWFTLARIQYELNYERLPLAKICEDWHRVVNLDNQKEE